MRSSLESRHDGLADQCVQGDNRQPFSLKPGEDFLDLNQPLLDRGPSLGPDIVKENDVVGSGLSKDPVRYG